MGIVLSLSGYSVNSSENTHVSFSYVTTTVPGNPSVFNIQVAADLEPSSIPYVITFDLSSVPVPPWGTTFDIQENNISDIVSSRALRFSQSTTYGTLTLGCKSYTAAQYITYTVDPDTFSLSLYLEPPTPIVKNKKLFLNVFI